MPTSRRARRSRSRPSCRGGRASGCGRSRSQESRGRCSTRTARRCSASAGGTTYAAAAPEDPGEALDAHHFAERFGLFLIILLGEVVVEAGQTSAAGHVHTAGGWAALGAAMILAGALWWLYFDGAAEINLQVLQLSGGSTTIARAIFAVGHMLPAFGLIVTAAGVGLLLEADPPVIAPWFACVGAGIYLAGTRGFARRARTGRSVARILMVVATFFLGRLEPALGARGFLWLLTGWIVLCAVLAYYDGRHALSS